MDAKTKSLLRQRKQYPLYQEGKKFCFALGWVCLFALICGAFVLPFVKVLAFYNARQVEVAQIKLIWFIGATTLLSIILWTFWLVLRQKARNCPTILRCQLPKQDFKPSQYDVWRRRGKIFALVPASVKIFKPDMFSEFFNVIELNTKAMEGKWFPHLKFYYPNFKVRIGCKEKIILETLQIIFANPARFRAEVKKELEKKLPQYLSCLHFDGDKPVSGKEVGAACRRADIEVRSIPLVIRYASRPDVLTAAEKGYGRKQPSATVQVKPDPQTAIRRALQMIHWRRRLAIEKRLSAEES
ncbi:hypothetical protein COU01_01900 [Candidatus Falkowbacteria bacterium CG10_big_fil_rev_8_21_14_0_10_44_15]|uniref:Uncharacterized protein n=1 Tax=Candidatus Falkowbacteria bacterium CG10_big_fil_rev_8_21_14_0_10_44_15 TaxID=1974569 RepID=A0A2H0V015_9BACT|nr:MAG: hypothetical protein COU01_01900 [Candidatus Falkowbacteria bacterium CG10_big_fil_rev_8_21_14_0_10_44_15]